MTADVSGVLTNSAAANDYLGEGGNAWREFGGRGGQGCRSGAFAARPLMRVFLSYASRDSGVAAQLTRDWRERGVEVFRFGDPVNQAGIIVAGIEEEIRTADAFVAVMSHDYLASPWCKRESSFAIQRENELPGRFIYVVGVDGTRPTDAGFLSAYSWVGASGELTAPRLDEIAVALPFGGRPTGANPEFTGFRNREDELNALLNGLQTAGGRGLWAVVSPPLMGKTWLLIKLEKALVNADPAWSVRRMDLRREPVELRHDPARLVARLLQLDDMAAAGLGNANLRAMALRAGKRPGPLLFILDSADLLTPARATAARTALTAVHRIVRRIGRVEPFALVVATRRHDEWRGLGLDARTGQRFDTLTLSQFGEEVVYQALLPLPHDLGVEQRWSHAAGLQRLSEGLPALLVRSVQWAERTGFLDMADADGPAAFDAVARDYVQEDLLAAESLLPSGADRPDAALAVLRSTLLVLSTYRLYTQSHLTFHLESDPTLQEHLEAAGWNRDDLWEKLGRTALQSNLNPDEIWHEIEPSLRRLLHRYHHRTDSERGTAHATARRFYTGWSANRAAGREQQVVLVECLWHEAVRLTIEEPDAVADRLPGIAEELSQACGAGPMYHLTEFREAVVRRLNDDEELQVLLMNHDGLFAEIVGSVRDAIGSDS